MFEEHAMPGGGNNDRTAAKLGSDGKWNRCEFEALRQGDLAVLFEADGTPVEDWRNPGCYVWYVAKDPVHGHGGWVAAMTSVANLATYDPRLTPEQETWPRAV